VLYNVTVMVELRITGPLTSNCVLASATGTASTVRVIVLSHWPHVATHVATQVATHVASVKAL